MKPEIWLVLNEDRELLIATSDVGHALAYAASQNEPARVWRVYGLESYERWASLAQGAEEKGKGT